jgi:Zn-dependent protease
MFPSFRAGTLLGFPLRVHLSFILLLGMVLLFMGGLPGLAVVLMVAGSVLLHELGHALVARHLNVAVSEIGLHFFGGAARLAGLPRRPRDEMAIAAAGPAVSFMLAGLGHGLAAVTGVPVFALFGWVNLVLGAFNLLPVFPSDGGRILRAVLARRHGLVRATEFAVTVGRVACVALILGGLYVGSVQMVFVAVALWTFGTAERLAVRSRGDHGAWMGQDAPPLAHAEYLPPPGLRREPFVPGARRAVFVWRR